MPNFPAVKHIETIRDALWCGTGYGRAAVMVGSGFSRNARPKLLSARPMPTWSGLTRRLYSRLHPAIRSDAEGHKPALIRSEATSEALRLADEFQATFGRQQLEDALLEIVPDNDYLPGSLHQLLLRLPWADVLTTNYDTLIERTRETVHERRYDLVERVSDIPRASRPRIVKLHGSFPAHRPFIISAEDFRTYPQMFAGFVNLAQQTAMENVLCLLGFSGEDPNFLHWTGWARDHLGTASPRIYLCGLLNLKDSDHLLLDRRNVTPVDLSPLFPTTQFPDASTRHALATEWLLLSLEAGRPYNPRSWPKPQSPVTGTRGLPESLPVCQRSPKQERWEVGEPDEKALLNVVSEWRHNRDVYPGWVVPPRGVRTRVYDITSNWARSLIKLLPKLEPINRLGVLFELNWRLEVCLCPLWDDIAPEVDACLKAFNPYPRDFGELSGTQLVQGRDSLTNDDWGSVRGRWFHLAVALLRYYREERRSADFRQLAERLERISELNSDQTARLRYEKGLFAIAYLDDEVAHAELRAWPSDTSDPVWDLRRAALVAELGDGERAENLVAEALNRLRTGSRLHPDHIPQLSREGWAIAILNGVTFLRHHGEGSARTRRDNRLQELEPLECDPWGLLGAFDAVDAGNAPVEKKQGELRLGFQPDQVSRSFSSNDVGSRLLVAYQLMRLAEEVGYPARCANVSLYAGRLKAAAEWFLNYDPVRTQSVMCRLLDEKLLARYLVRHRVAALSTEVVNELAETALRAVRASLLITVAFDYRQHDPVSERVRNRIAAAVQILGRVLVRLPGERINELWPLAFDLYSSAYAKGHPGFPDELTELFASLISTSEPEVLESHFVRLASLPIPGSADFIVHMPQHWPELTKYVQDRIDLLNSKPSGADWDIAKARLLAVAESGEGIAKHRAVSRLLALREYKCLTQSEVRHLTRLLWSRTDPATRLPNGWPFYNWVWLTLSPPNGSSSLKRFREYALGGRAEPEVDKLTSELLTDWLGATRRNSRLEPNENRQYVDWTVTDAQRMLAWIRKWWSEKGQKALPSDRPRHPLKSWAVALTSSETRNIFTQLVAALRWIIIPRVSRHPKTRLAVADFVAELEINDVAVGEAIPALSLFDQTPDVAGRLRAMLASPDQQLSTSALRGLIDWVVNQRKPGEPDDGTRLPPPPADLVHDLGYLVASRKWPGLDQALGAAAVVLEKLSGQADEVFLRSILTGLEYLLEETAYRETEMGDGPIPYDWIPRCRERAARVVVQLARHGHRSRSPVAKWLDAIRTDSLPEVRFAARGVELV